MRISTLKSVALVAAAFLLLVSDASAQTIAAARTGGPGQVVTLTGVVTRAKGAFVQMQDASMAGITIRETATTNAAFFDAVANGTIAPGTTLTVTGLTSEFNGLFQINGPDLTAYTVGATVAVPAPQDITVAQLTADGEQYEGELVRISGVMIAGAGGVFTERTNVDLTQAGAVGTLRVANAGDTDIDDTPIPTGLATVTGVVSQFDNTSPPTGTGTGYQIQPILASDVMMGGTASEAGAAGNLSLRVANPLRGGASALVASPDAEARLAVYDVLGRQVAAVAAASGQVAIPALAPGVYVLRLTAGPNVLTQTVTVVR